MLLAAESGSTAIDLSAVVAAAIGVVGAIVGALLAAWLNRRTQLNTLEAERSAQREAREAERTAQREARDAAALAELETLVAEGLAATDHVIADVDPAAYAQFTASGVAYEHLRDIADHWRTARQSLVAASLQHPDAAVSEQARQLGQQVDQLLGRYRSYLLSEHAVEEARVAVEEARHASAELVRQIGRRTGPNA